MSTEITVQPYEESMQDAVRDLIVPIQRDEFSISVSYEEQPDLRNIDTFYGDGASGFWVALHQGQLVGTVALLDIGNGQAALRKMFVSREFRGREYGVARALLGHLVQRARGRHVTDIYLGTTSAFKAAHRFYEKSGFELIEEAMLPASFPRMAVDSRFYRMPLAVDGT